MSKKIIIASHKGGVNKSTIAANLGLGFANDNQKVLMIDTDSQANLSKKYLKDDYRKVNGIYELLKGEDVNNCIHHTDYDGLDIIPAKQQLSVAKKEMLLKAVCCLMLLQINGEAKGNTQIRAAQKATTYLQKGLPVGSSSQHFQKMAFPIKSESEIVLPSCVKITGTRMPVSDSQKMGKANKVLSNTPFIQRKMNMRSAGKNGKNNNRTGSMGSAQKGKSGSFQWTRISSQQGGKLRLNRAVANRMCNEHYQD